jgi:DNA-binding CsgD family transcriptional regulator/tetratricopeptide (TPR) repeat protein
MVVARDLPSSLRSVSAGCCPSKRRFVGREPELALLEQAVARASAGRPQVVCVQGPAGIGKSALLEQLVERCGLQVLRVAGSEDEAAVPFAVIDQLLRHDPSAIPAPEWGDPIAAGARLLALVSSFGSTGPVGLLVDDLHWVDGPSAQAIAFMLRRLGQDRVIALFGLRDEHGSVPPGLARLFTSAQASVLTLAGLDRSDLRKLADVLGAGDVPTRVLEQLEEMTTGNPLHATALFDELDLRVFAAGTDSQLPAPRSYARVVAARLARCSPATERLVVAASVLGPRCRLAHAAELAELRQPLAAVEEASRQQLLVTLPTATGIDLGFCHPLVRAAVYHDLGIARRGALHEAAATMVDHEAARLRHRAAACPGDDDHLADELAGFASGMLTTDTPGAVTAAATAFEAAARVGTSPSTREQHLMSAMECRLATGDAGAATLLAEATSGFTPSPRLGYLHGALALSAGRIDDAERVLLLAWEAADQDTDPAVTAGIAAQLATLHLRRANADETTRWARRAHTDTPNRLALGLSPRMVLAVGLATAGRYRDALATIPALPEDHPARLDPTELDLLASRGIVRLWSDDTEGARRDLTTAIDAARRHGAFTASLFALFYLAEVEFRLGAWDDAIVHGQLGVSMAEDGDQYGPLALAHGNAALPLACRGEWDAAQAHVDAAMRAVTALPDETNITWAHTARAVLAAARGNHAAVVESAQTIARTLHSGGDEPSIKPWRVLGAEALAALGDPASGDRMLRRHEERVDAEPLPHASAAAARARALVELAAGRIEAAEQHFRDALARVEALPIPFERAQTQLAFGGFRRRQGQRRHAATLLTAANRTFFELGAAPYVDRTERELAACGLTPSPRTAEGRWQLTPQELAVAHLVAKGLRNREVATELVVSVKTVEYHLANVFRKVAVTNRSQLTALLVRG